MWNSKFLQRIRQEKDLSVSKWLFARKIQYTYCIWKVNLRRISENSTELVFHLKLAGARGCLVEKGVLVWVNVVTQ